MKTIMIFLAGLFIAGSLYSEAVKKDQFMIKSYTAEEKSLKVEITKMWKDGWYPRGLTTDGSDKITVLFIKNGTEMYKDWLIRFSADGTANTIKQDTLAEINAGWMPVDITIASAKAVSLYLKPKEVIRVWDNVTVTVDMMPITAVSGEYKKSFYTPSGLFLQSGNPVMLKILSPVDTSFSYMIRTYPGDEASVQKGIEQASAEGLQPWGIEKSGGEMKVIYFSF
jgi:hypothetical protein